ncbi:MAG: hypothetical protein CMP81_09045 [Fulvimarina sp.]|nr:hypothetical protein [Fulvimarina sp.]
MRGGRAGRNGRSGASSGARQPATRRRQAGATAPSPETHAATAALLHALTRGDFPAATAALDILVVAEPDNAALHYNHALALRLSGRPGDGFAAARRARELDPANVKALFEICACGLEAGEPQASFDAGTAYLASHPGDPDAALNTARAALLLDRQADALEILSEIAAGALSDGHHLCRGEALRDLGRFDEAERAWASVDPAHAGIVLSLRSKGARGRLALNPRSSPS